LINGDTMRSNKVIFIVLDGAPFDVFYSLAQKGVLPNMQKLMKKGCFNLLNSTIPPTSPVAIPSLLTGRNPGKHGMFGFGYKENGIFRPYTSKSFVGETIYDILAFANKKVILLNVPWTFPPFKVNGIMISGPPSPGNRAESYPPEIIRILRSKIGEYYVDLNIKALDYMGFDEEAFIKEAYLVTKRRAEAFYYLMNNYEWDLFLAVFTTLDRMQHVFFGYLDEESPFFNAEKRKILIDYYKKIDNILGKTISLLNEDTFLVVASDHGFEYLSKYVGLNNILAEAGFIEERSKFNVFTIERIMSFLHRIGLKYVTRMLSERTQNIVRASFPARTDYSRSKCYALSGGAFVINRNHIATEQAVEVFKKRLTDILYAMEDDSDRVVEKVYERSEIYHGNRVGDAPDLIIVPRKGYELRAWAKETLEPVKIVENRTVKTGTHISFASRKGIFIISGPNINEGLRIMANIVDIAPTILHILGVPVSPSMDGKVLRQIFKPKSRFKTQRVKLQEVPKREKEYRQLEYHEEDIKERLRKLGYISDAE